VLLEQASDEQIKTLIECAINTLNGNCKLSKGEKCKLSKYKSRLRALIKKKIIFKTKRNLLFNKGGFIFTLLTSIITGVIGALIHNV
jgi:hypothetical protein